VSSANANVDSKGSLPAEKLGRRLGIALFWLMLVYVISMSAVSIIPALYFPAIAPTPPETAVKLCALRIDELERDLLARTTAVLKRGDAGGLDRWLATWDKRLAELAGGCGALESARQDLLKLRAGIGSLLSSYRSGPLRIQQRLDRALEPWPSRADERPET
jgi:hypothetical protein